MRVYHYLKAEHGLDDIARKRLKISRLSDLNDPFELLSTEMRNREWRKLFNELKNDISEKFGVLCFSRNWHNPLLWSHYADKHKGMCLGFDVPRSYLMEMTYSGRRLLMSIENEMKKFKLDEEFMKKMLSTKYKDWKYEDEVRLFLNLEEQDLETSHYFKEFSEEIALKQIILGQRCEFTKTEVEKRLSSYGKDVQVIPARLAFGSFRVVRDKSK